MKVEPAGPAPSLHAPEAQAGPGTLFDHLLRTGVDPDRAEEPAGAETSGTLGEAEGRTQGRDRFRPDLPDLLPLLAFPVPPAPTDPRPQSAAAGSAPGPADQSLGLDALRKWPASSAQSGVAPAPPADTPPDPLAATPLPEIQADPATSAPGGGDAAPTVAPHRPAAPALPDGPGPAILLSAAHPKGQALAGQAPVGRETAPAPNPGPNITIGPAGRPPGLARAAPGPGRHGPSPDGRADSSGSGNAPADARAASAPAPGTIPAGPSRPLSGPEWSGREPPGYGPAAGPPDSTGPTPSDPAAPPDAPAGTLAENQADASIFPAAPDGSGALIEHVLLGIGAADALDIRLTVGSEEARSDVAAQAERLLGELQSIGAKVEAVRVETGRAPAAEAWSGTAGGQEPGPGARGEAHRQEDAAGSAPARMNGRMHASPDRPLTAASADGGKVDRYA
jgi:hypothetical protein